jgi:hypothetical protein
MIFKDDDRSETTGSDLLLRCRDCQRDFTFCSGEQAFFQANGLQPPRRCPECRLAKRRAREAHEGEWR